ncbi:MAG: VOC family protein [Pseudomonadota bacterium]
MNRRSILQFGTAMGAASFTAIPVSATAAASQPLADSRFDHMSLNVRDFDAMMAWYQRALGFTVAVAWRVDALNGKRLAYLDLGTTRLELVEADSDGIGLPEAADFLDHFARTGYGHLCFAVADVDQVMDDLATAGVPTFVRPETYDLDGTPYRRRVGFMKDPEGNVLEFGEPLIRVG